MGRLKLHINKRLNDKLISNSLRRNIRSPRNRNIPIQNLLIRHSRKSKRLTIMARIHSSQTKRNSTKYTSPISRSPIPHSHGHITTKRNRCSQRNLRIPKHPIRIHIPRKLPAKPINRKLHRRSNKKRNMVPISPNHRSHIHPQHNIHRRLLKPMEQFQRPNPSHISNRRRLHP